MYPWKVLSPQEKLEHQRGKRFACKRSLFKKKTKAGTENILIHDPQMGTENCLIFQSLICWRRFTATFLEFVERNRKGWIDDGGDSKHAILLEFEGANVVFLWWFRSAIKLNWAILFWIMY